MRFWRGKKRPEPSIQVIKQYSAAISTIKYLKKTGPADRLARLLLDCVDATEAEAKAVRHGIAAPHYYEQLAILYRKQKRFEDEAAILKRFSKQPHGDSTKCKRLITRIDRALELAAKHQRA